MPHPPSLARRSLLLTALAGGARAGERPMRLRFRFAGHEITARLEDNPSAADLLSLLPLDIVIEDFSNNEKIAHLPRKLDEAGGGPFGAEAPGDLCYYAPWGNLAFFYAGYRYSRGLIRLGRLEGGIGPLLTRGRFALRAERLA